MENNSNKKWWRALLRIPAMLLIDVVVLFAAVMIDVRIFSNSDTLGHGAPFVTILAFMLMAVITVIVVIFSLIKALVLLRRSRDEK